LLAFKNTKNKKNQNLQKQRKLGGKKKELTDLPKRRRRETDPKQGERN
jgi:hypothetical protein